MPGHDSPCAPSIEVKIAYAELLLRKRQVFRASGEDRTGQGIRGAVRHVQGLGKGSGFHEGQHRTEDLLLSKPMLRPNVSEDRERDGMPPFDRHGLFECGRRNEAFHHLPDFFGNPLGPLKRLRRKAREVEFEAWRKWFFPTAKVIHEMGRRSLPAGQGRKHVYESKRGGLEFFILCASADHLCGPGGLPEKRRDLVSGKLKQSPHGSSHSDIPWPVHGAAPSSLSKNSLLSLP